jgi:hypothetical protein
MLSLIKKDVRVIALTLCVVVPVFGLFMVVGLLAGGVYFAMSCLLTAVVVSTAPALDWRARADLFVHSLPVTRRDVVRARYLTALLLAAGSLMGASALAVGFAVLRTRYGVSWPTWVAVETGLTAATCMGLYMALFLGGVYRFGWTIGGALSGGMFGGLVPTAGRLVSPGAVAGYTAVLGLAPVALVMLSCTALALWLSLLFSQRVYARREFS